jgi:hypothetical protein
MSNDNEIIKVYKVLSTITDKDGKIVHELQYTTKDVTIARETNDLFRRAMYKATWGPVYGLDKMDVDDLDDDVNTYCEKMGWCYDYKVSMKRLPTSKYIKRLGKNDHVYLD